MFDREIVCSTRDLQRGRFYVQELHTCMLQRIAQWKPTAYGKAGEKLC